MKCKVTFYLNIVQEEVVECSNYQHAFEKAVEQGKIDESTIDDLEITELEDE